MKNISLTFFAFLFSVACYGQMPAPITGATNICVGSYTTLADATSGGTWSSSDPATASVGSSSGIVTGGVTGTVVIAYTTSGGSVTTSVAVDPLPVGFAITGGGAYCSGGTGVPIGLVGSEVGIDYRLLNGGIPVGAGLTGTGSVLDFGLETGAGSYTVVATNSVTTCTQVMTGSATIAVNSLPALYNVTGGGSFCAGGTGVHLVLDGSDIGVAYKLYNGATLIGSPTPGTGSAIDFGAQTTAGTYTVIANNVTTGCTRTMSGSGTVTIDPLPTAFIVTGSGSYCTGGAGIHIGLTGSNAGIAYQLWIGGAPVGTTITGTGAALDFGLQTAIGTYTIIATNAITGCSRAMTGSAVISIGTPPLPITGPSTMCLWSTITLSDATAGGTWSCSNFAIATISPFSGEITAVASGVAAITYTAPTGCYATKTVTVQLGPMPLSGPSAVCIGSSITLSDGVSGGVWTSSNTAIATTGSLTGVVTGVSLGTATIVYSLGTGCVATKVVTVTPGPCSGTPVAGTATPSATTVCPGGSVILGLSGASYGCGISNQWQHSVDGSAYTDIPAGVAASISLNPTTSEYYRCRVTCTNSGLFSYSIPVFVSVRENIASHAILSVSDTSCTGTHFYISACGISPSLNVTTFYGDGKSDNTALTTSGVCHADVFHSYATPGTYFIKQVLYIGAIPQDSVSFSYEYLYCRTLPIKYYFDANSNCVFDGGDGVMLLPIATEVDSNGIPVDTISATSGLYYKAYGPVGTVYSFKVISAPEGLRLTCPSAGILYDTIQATVNDYHPKFFGFNCISGSGSFDLAEYVWAQTGRHLNKGTIWVDNTFCTPENATVTLIFNPRYDRLSSVPLASSVVGNTATWNLTGVSSSSPIYPMISYTLDISDRAHWFTPGDTIHTYYTTVATTIGELDTSNNTISRCDTANGSFDPNEISVLPQGKILPCTKLQYTINFENTGNDTAHNISVLDTLDDNLDPHTLNIEIASSAMNIAIIKDAGHNVIKFDFPGINLLDSSHHGKCDGMVIYNIKTKPGVATGTSIFNYAGIFFDDNPAVMTNTVANTIGMNPITGPNNVCAGEGITLTSPYGFGGGAWSSSSGAVATVGTTGAVTGVSAGPVTITYSISGSCGTTYTADAVTVKALPAAHAVTGGGSYCAGGTGVSVGIASSDAGVNYLLYRGAASTGPFTGTGAALDFGLQTLAGTYTVAATGTSTGCHSDMPGSVEVTITPTVAPSVTISTGDVVCAGASTTFTPVPVNGGTTPTYVWNVNGVNVGVGGTYIYLPANGDIVTTTLTSNAPCAVPATASSSVTMSVEYPLTLTVLVTASPGTSVVSGEEVTFAAALSGGGIASFQWDVNGTDITGATNATYTTNTLNDHDLVKCTVKTGNACGDVTATNAVGVTVSNNVGVHDPGSLNGMVVLAPNPNKGVFTIHGFSGQARDEEVSVQITNMMGQVVYKNVTTAQSGNIDILVQLPANLVNGVYMLGLHSGSGNSMMRFVVE